MVRIHFPPAASLRTIASAVWWRLRLRNVRAQESKRRDIDAVTKRRGCWRDASFETRESQMFCRGPQEPFGENDVRRRRSLHVDLELLVELDVAAASGTTHM